MIKKIDTQSNYCDRELLQEHGFSVSLGSNVGNVLSIRERIKILEVEIEKHLHRNPSLMVGKKSLFDTGEMYVEMTLNKNSTVFGFMNICYDRVAGDVSIWVSKYGIVHTYICPTTGWNDTVT